MFSFLNSTVLFAALAALVPLIIHLFSRRRVKIVEFSSLKHLKAMQKRQVRRLKIRQLLLLILRMLIILLVVLAFARPTMQSGGVGSHASVSAVILFDNSASMSRFVADGSLFEVARKRTQELLNTFGEADEVLLLTLDNSIGQEGPRGFSSVATVTEQLAAVPAGAGRADLEAALDRAAGMLDQAVNLNKEIYIITDRQRHILPDRDVLAGYEARTFFVDLPIESSENCGITQIDFGGQFLLPGHEFDLTATVKNYGGEDRDDIIASLFIDGNRVGQTDLQVPAGKEGKVRFTRSVSRTGFHSGRIELSDDGLMEDNRRYFSLHIPDRFNLLIIEGDISARFISLALVPSLSINQYWSVKEAAPDNLAGVNFLDYDVIIMAGAPRLAETYVERLKAFVDRGRALMVTYGGETDIEYFNSRWSDVTGVVFDEPIREDFSRAGYYSLGSIDVNHPVFSAFTFEDNRPPDIKFYTLGRAHVTGEARVLMRFTGDRPALVENNYRGGKVLTFAGPAAPQDTDLPGHAFFVPLVSRSAEYLASDLSGFDLDLQVGRNITRSVSLRGSIRMPLQMLTPDSSVVSISPEEAQGALVFHPRPTSRPGIYRVTYMGEEIDRFAVNVAPDEGDLSAVEIDEMATALGADDYRVLEQDRDMAAIVAELRLGKELWQLMVWLAVILLAAEMLLSRGSAGEE